MNPEAFPNEQRAMPAANSTSSITQSSSEQQKISSGRTGGSANGDDTKISSSGYCSGGSAEVKKLVDDLYKVRQMGKPAEKIDEATAEKTGSAVAAHEASNPAEDFFGTLGEQIADLPPIVPAPPAEPGAHPMGLALRASQQGGGTRLPDGAPDPEATANNEGLAVATAVNADLESSLPRASMDDSANGKPNQTSTTQLLAGLLFLVVVVVVVLVAVIVVLAAPEEEEVMDPVDAPVVTQVPTPPPTSMEGYLLSLLQVDPIESVSSSPQAKAFDWLVEDVIDYNPQAPPARIRQRYALAVLYFATSGESWVHNEHWLDHEVHECLWFHQKDFGMKNTFSMLFPGYLEEFPPEEANEAAPRCDGQGQYLALWLDANGLSGTLPTELYMLTSLRTMSFGYNQGLTGSISSHIGALTNLEGMVFMELLQAGAIPSQIGLLSNNLRALQLYGNKHTGVIPSQIWQLTNLVTLSLGTNSNIQDYIDDPIANPRLEGTIPSSVGRMTNLRWFHIIHSRLSGSIPTEMGKLSQLVWFSLSGNLLTGTIPSELGELTATTLITLWDNQLTGTIPTEFYGMTSLGLCTVANNQLSGTISTEVGRLTNVRELLDFTKNSGLHGSIPTEIGLLSTLEEFSVSENDHTGTIPSQLGLLTGLEWLGLKQNSFSGTIPNELSALKNSLYLLELADNPLLTGTFPADICEVNNTCVDSPLNFKRCEPTEGVHFDCTDTLSGCDCPGLPNETVFLRAATP